MVEPVDPDERCELDLVEVPPRAFFRITSALKSPMIVSAVVRVANAADRRLDAGLGEPLRVVDSRRTAQAQGVVATLPC